MSSPHFFFCLGLTKYLNVYENTFIPIYAWASDIPQFLVLHPLHK